MWSTGCTGKEPTMSPRSRSPGKDEAVELGTIEGRLKIRVVMDERHRGLLAYCNGEADLCFVRGQWLLACIRDIPETETFNAEDWLGADLGVVTILSDRDGTSDS